MATYGYGICPACGHAGEMRTLHVDDVCFGDGALGHTETECEKCGWNSRWPKPVPCPGCGADLRRKDAIVRVGTLEGLVTGQGRKRLYADGGRYAVSFVPGEHDRVTDQCAACGGELGFTDWPRIAGE